MNIPAEKPPGFIFYDDPLTFYNAMLADIKAAQKYVYLETYRYSNDPIGVKFRDALTRKARQGVEVIILIDSWGASVSENFFTEMIKLGAKVKFFKKLKLHLNFFSKNHHRNHRKLLLVDDKISYIGSANITGYSINWRESVLRIEGDIALTFKKIFFEDYGLSKKYILNKKTYSRSEVFGDFEIIKDIPGTLIQATHKRFLKLIKSAKKEIIIETPYFLPGSSIRKALISAAERGIKVVIITPLHSDVGLFDILRNKYLGLLYKNNIEILQYYSHNLHAKLMLVDKNWFCVGSSNFDYRSFRFQHEINLLGKNPYVVSVMLQHIEESKVECENFDFERWRKRSRILKVVEWILVPLRHFF